MKQVESTLCFENSRFTKIRDKNTNQKEYAQHCDRLCNILAEEALAYKTTQRAIETACGKYQGQQYPDFSKFIVVSIVRSGDILSEAFRRLVPEIKTGKILIQRDETDPEKKAKLFYSKLPPISDKTRIILCDPMLATGGSVCCATKVLVEHGASETNILFVNVVSCPVGLENYNKAFPNVQVLTAAIDKELNEEKYIVPGLGDFGDRYYGT